MLERLQPPFAFAVGQARGPLAGIMQFGFHFWCDSQLAFTNAQFECDRNRTQTERGRMNLLDLTYPSPEENLACDEALLDSCDAGAGEQMIRFWEPQQHFVVVGYSNHVEREVNVEVCRERGVPILRRCSGGGTVVQGPGCLNYALVLRIESNPALETITGTNRFVMERNRSALEQWLSGSSRREEARSSNFQLPTSNSQPCLCGHTDLAIDGRKFSGNAQRRRRHAILFHGTFLLDFDLALVNRLLPMPSKEPDYRRSRCHAEFLKNLNAPAAEIKTALTQTWGAALAGNELPSAGIGELAVEKYSSDAWNLKF
jgi:lipoate-protein ligase A